MTVPVNDPRAESVRAALTQKGTGDARTWGAPGDAVPGTWGAFELHEEIGRGAFGRVYRAWEATLAREVALKIIRPPDGTPKAVDAILREGQLLARVRHPNIVTIHGALQVGPEIGLWMEFIRGRTLTDIVKSDGPRAAGEAALIGATLCQALAAVHRTGIVHRDIKAHNVMREAGGRLVLMDFGAGQALVPAGSREMNPVGTPVYMAPEVLAGGHASVRSDVYSLGVLLYYLVAGRYPVEGRTWTDFLLAHARAERRHLADVRPDLPQRFVQVVERATHSNPADRYPTAGAMLRDLGAGGISEDVTVVRTGDDAAPSAPRPSPPSWTRRLAAGSLGGAALILLAGAATSIAFNAALGRPARFHSESLLDWFSWGARAVVGTLFTAAVVAVVGFVLSVGIALMAALPGAKRRAAAVVRATSAWLGPAASSRHDALASAGAVVVLAALGAVCWQFDVLTTSPFLSERAAGEFDFLRPGNLVGHVRYRRAFEGVLLLAAVLVWTMRRLGVRPGWWPRAAMIAVAGAAALMIVVPYRVIWHNEFERVDLGGTRCYVLGADAGDLLLHCPGIAPPRNRIVSAAEPQLRRSGVVESIFTP